MFKRLALVFMLSVNAFLAFAQNEQLVEMLFQDTVFNIAFDSLKHNCGQIIPVADSKYLVKYFKYIGKEPLRITKAWTGDPHFICDYPKEDLIPDKVYSFKVCFSHKGREGKMHKQMGFDLSDGNRVFMLFSGEYIKQ